MVRPSVSILLMTLIHAQAASGYHMVCYFDSWAKDRTGVNKMVANEIPAKLCTHVIYAFVDIITDDGLLKISEPVDEETYRDMMELRKSNPKLKVMLGVDGGRDGDLKFSKMASSHKKKQDFMHYIIKYLRKYDFDGIDLDWEYPASEDKHLFAQLLRDLREAFDIDADIWRMKRLLLTSAVSAYTETINSAYDVPSLRESLDFINLMTYDLQGKGTSHNAPLKNSYYCVESAVNHWHRLGMPKEQIVVGLPAYGRTWSIVASDVIPPPGTPAEALGTLKYRDICSNPAYIANSKVDTKAGVPYTWANDIWVSYDDPTSYRTKCQYIKSNKLGGGMMWSLASDDHNGMSCGHGKFPLLSTISDCLL